MSFIDWTVDNFVLIAGLATTLRWVWEYSESRKFEKNKFLLERIEKFNNLESTKKMQKLLDWNSIKIDINGVSTKVDDSILMEALKTHNDKKTFDSIEVEIRETFDDYLTGLTELIILSKTGLVDKKNLKKFLLYWINILNGKKQNKPKEIINTFDKFIKYYGYVEVSYFLK